MDGESGTGVEGVGGLCKLAETGLTGSLQRGCALPTPPFQDPDLQSLQ